MNPGTDPMFDAAFMEVIGVEKGFVDHPSDQGGPTNFGITEATARHFGYTGDMRLMPMAVAKDIYRRGFYDPLRLAEVGAIAGARIVNELFEQNVNLRALQAGRHLQRALNSFNQRGRFYPDIVVDGDIGDKTLDALRGFIRSRGVTGTRVLFRALNAQQGTYYLERGEVRPLNEDFTYGWFDKRVA